MKEEASCVPEAQTSVEALKTLLAEGDDRGPMAITPRGNLAKLQSVMKEADEVNYSLLKVVSDEQEGS